MPSSLRRVSFGHTARKTGEVIRQLAATSKTDSIEKKSLLSVDKSDFSYSETATKRKLLNSYFHAFNFNINSFIRIGIILHRYTDFEPFALYGIKRNRHAGS